MKKSVLLLIVVIFTSCVKSNFKNGLTLKEVPFNNLEDWQYDDMNLAFNAFSLSCLKPQKSDALITFDQKKLKNICKIQKDYFPVNAKSFFEENFVPHLISYNSKSTGTFTGYHEAFINASRTRTAQYQYPIYKKPDDLRKTQLYYTRGEINQGVLNNRNLELLWTDDLVELFFTHIQGSAIVNLNDGEKIRIGFAAKNNQAYFAIGKYLIQQDYIKKENMSAKQIKLWLNNNPQQMDKVMNMNDSYIFFREVKAKHGPIGGQGVELTANRSIAIDKKYLPYGLPIWLETATTLNKKPLKQLFITQDTGSAIKGAIRGDIFFGSDKNAKELASKQNSKGIYYILLPK